MMVHRLNVAKAYVPALWKQESPPSISLWLTKTADIHAIEKVITTLQGKEETFNKRWTQWYLFVCSKEYGLALVEGE